MYSFTTSLASCSLLVFLSGCYATTSAVLLDTNYYAACQGNVALLQLEDKRVNEFNPHTLGLNTYSIKVRIYLDQVAPVVTGEHISLSNPCERPDRRPEGTIKFSDNSVTIDLMQRTLVGIPGDYQPGPLIKYHYNGSYEIKTIK